MSKWGVLPFDNIIIDDTRRATKIKKEEYLSYGKYQIVDQGKEQVSGYTDIDEGVYTEVPAIIFGDHTRIIKYIDKPLFLGADGVKLLKIKNESLNYKFLYYYFLKNEIPNTGYNRHFKWLKELLIPIPPLDVQKHISDTLDKVQEIINIHKIELEEFDNLIKAIFYEMFGDLIINERNWETSTVETVCDNIFGGGTPSKSKSEYYVGDIPWVTPKDMKSISILDSIDHINEEAINNSSAKLIPTNSVLMVIRSGILKKQLPVAINKVEVAVNQDMKAFVVSDKIKSEYLLYYFIMTQNNILKNVRSVTADNIEFGLIKKASLPLPPLELQNKFAKIVENIEDQKSIVKHLIAESENLFNSLMSKYFDK
jgi:type I restriction enzyme, S subunit